MRIAQMFIAAGFVAAGSAVSHGALIMDLRVAGPTPKLATVSGAGATVNVQVWATVSGTNANTTDEGFRSVSGSLLSSSGGLAVNFTQALAVSPFDGSSHQDTNNVGTTLIAPTDLDSDGDLDIGSNNTAQAAGFFIVRSNNAMEPGTEFMIGTAQVQVGGSSGSTSLNWRFRPSGGQWLVDGSTLTATSDPNLTVGAPLIIQVPEPAGIALVGTAAAGLLARRRSRRGV